jgi:D-3-phosphoglycerate dehydrogenase
MYNIQLMNKIAKCGLDNFDAAKYTVGEDVADATAMLVRSADLHETVFPETLKCIARAGAGVNNIPLDKCADAGIVVFNTPGANANGVKEIVLAGLFLAARDIVGGIEWAKGLEGDPDAAKKVEKGKSSFAGGEILGKTLGVVGLGAIGRLVANAADALGMKVVGYDPYLSDEAAKLLAPSVKKAAGYDEIYAEADYITLHIPATADTKGMFNADVFAKMKDGVKLLNFSRDALVKTADLIDALNSGKVAKYVVDFPTADTIGVHKNIIAIPHLGASTEESEDNCAVMAAKQTVDYLENGNIVNSVNYPKLVLERSGAKRICVLAKNADIAKINEVVGASIQSASATRGDYLYAIYDVDADNTVCPKCLGAVDGVIKAFVL